MDFTDLMFITILACSAILCYRLVLINKELEELKELWKKNKRK